ncbi:MAG: hypothetical protein K2M87_01595 [Muribaculaceae bacterium]|nr:hypothetical protein [Muribaculaceae bacterium]
MKKVLICMMVTLACFLMSGQVYAVNVDNIVANSNTESDDEDNNGESDEQVREFTNYYCEGTEWYYSCKDIIVNDDFSYTLKRIVYKEWLEGEIELGDKKYFCVWRLCEDRGINDPQLLSYVRTEESKVWKKNVDRPDEPEILIFDFNLAPGDVFDEYSYNVDEFRINVKTTCSERIQFPKDKEGLPSLKMTTTTYSQDFDIAEEYDTYWICGVGGLGGLDEPRYRNKYLYSLYHNGTKIFDNEPSGVEDLQEEYVTPHNGNKYHLDGRVFKEGDRGISISNGKKVIRN